MMRMTGLLLVAGWLCVGAGCSSGSDSGNNDNGSCLNDQGTWSLSGNCDDTACNVAQNGCSISFTCSPSGAGYTGSMSNNSICFGGSGLSRSGNVGCDTGSGTCSSSAGTCNGARPAAAARAAPLPSECVLRGIVITHYAAS